MNEKDFYARERELESSGGAESVGRYTAQTFLWMFLGLAVTFAVAFAGYASGAVLLLASVPLIQVFLLVAEIGVVLVLSARLERLSIPVARALFFVYAILNGVVFSSLFWVFELSSLILVFGATALYFGVLALFGYATGADLSRLRNILVGGLFCLLAFGVLSFFIPGLGRMDRLYCLVGIAVFLGFTAYDTQRIKGYYAAYAGNPELLGKASIYAALQLYLDFINLFLYLLRFLGRRKN